MLTVEPCDLPPPLLSNAYSDGSVRHPGSPFSSATFGVFWPGRKEQDWSTQERNYAAKVDLGPVYQGAGIVVAGTVPGIFLSSGRAELAGAIVAILSQDFIKLKADSKGVIDKTLKHMQLGSAGRKPWPLHQDGDLWQLLFSVAQARGLNTFTVQWCKGHVTLQFLRDDKVRREMPS